MKSKPSKAQSDHDRALQDFVERLAHVTILDPACGSGNFLYVAINLLLDLEKVVIAYGASHGTSLIPQVRPTQLHGIEINQYAQQLAQVVIWIGYLQWKHHNGFPSPRNPVLEPIETIEFKDAILDRSDPANPREPEWPVADFIVGNPPFLGSRLLHRKLDDSYVDGLFRVYENRLPKSSDLCCYWFEKARSQIECRNVRRVGLLGTQAIRGGANQTVLQRIKATGDIFFAVSDRDWILDGAAVHVSMVGFDAGDETLRVLDDVPESTIHPNLQGGVDLTCLARLDSNKGVAFQGVTPMGPFDIPASLAAKFLQASGNPNGRPNSDVIRRWANGADLIDGRTDEWIIDFGCGTSMEHAAMYEMPFAYCKSEVLKARMLGETEEATEKFWLHWRPRPAMRDALRTLSGPRFLVTPRVAKHRLFIWVGRDWLPSDATVAFAVDDDIRFGILQSRIHETFARRTGTQLREAESGFRYSHQLCFETFPFPLPSKTQAAQIMEAAAELDRARSRWALPSEWTREEVLNFSGSVDGPWSQYIHKEGTNGLGDVTCSRTVPVDSEAAGLLAERTLTNLYNERPTWLDLAHKKLDAAVFDAYGWSPELSDNELLARLLALNLERSQKG